MFQHLPKLFGIACQLILDLMLTSFGMPAESEWILQL
jgi:hypothetical protein